MKKTKKILISILVLICALSLFCISAFASEGEEDGAATAEYEENAFDIAYSYVTENADKLFSMLAFAGTLIIAFSYKKGLFPYVSKALASLNGAVKKINEQSEKTESGISEVLVSLSEKLSQSESTVAALESRLNSLDSKIDSALPEKKRNEALMLGELELLYEILTASSLPQYRKDRVGEVFARIKSQLAGDEANES